MHRTARSAAGAALLTFLLSAPAAAQQGLRQFGVWLDDATVSPAGQGYATFSVGYVDAQFGHQWDAPALDVGVGIPNRIQLSVSAPVTRVVYDDGTSTHSIGDIYGAVKFTVLDPTAKGRSFGLAVVPVVEFLSSNSVLEGAGRTFWALPVAVESRFEKFRLYGSAGYFSRGSVFLASAIEVPVSSKITATGSLSFARSTKGDPESDAQDLARSRCDLSAGAVYFFNQRATFFASLGRTLSRIDANATVFSFSAGVSFGFQHHIGAIPGTTPAGPKKHAVSRSGAAS